MRPRRLRVPDGLREQRFEPRHRALPVDHSTLPSQPIGFFPLFPPHAFLAPAPRVGNLALLARIFARPTRAGLGLARRFFTLLLGAFRRLFLIRDLPGELFEDAPALLRRGDSFEARVGRELAAPPVPPRLAVHAALAEESAEGFGGGFLGLARGDERVRRRGGRRHRHRERLLHRW